MRRSSPKRDAHYLDRSNGDVRHLDRRVFRFRDEIQRETEEEQQEEQNENDDYRAAATSLPRLLFCWRLDVELLVEGTMLGSTVRSLLAGLGELHLEYATNPATAPLSFRHRISFTRYNVTTPTFVDDLPE